MLKYNENTLPMVQDTGMSHHVIKEANKVVELDSEKQQENQVTPGASRKREYTTSFMAENRAEIGKYATEHGNARAVVLKYGVGDSTVRLFKSKYFILTLYLHAFL